MKWRILFALFLSWALFISAAHSSSEKMIFKGSVNDGNVTIYWDGSSVGYVDDSGNATFSGSYDGLNQCLKWDDDNCQLCRRGPFFLAGGGISDYWNLECDSKNGTFNLLENAGNW